MIKIDLEKGKITFKNDGQIIAPGLRQKDFTINKDSIALVGIKFGMLLDDEEKAIVIIDKQGKKYYLSLQRFDTESWKRFSELIGISIDFAEIPGSYYDAGHSFIIYPKNHEGKPLYKKWHRSIKGILLTFSKLFWGRWPDGIFTKESRKVLNRLGNGNG